VNAFRRDGSINVMVESPRGSAIKFKYDQNDRAMTVSRPLPLGLVFPFDWGFIPGTRAADGDPLDAFILWDGSSYPGSSFPVDLSVWSTSSRPVQRHHDVTQ